MRSTRLPTLMLVLAFLTSLTVHVLMFSYSQLKDSIINELQLTYAEAGFIFSISFSALIALRVPWGIIVDRIGFKTSLGTGLIFLGVFGVLRGLAINYGTLLLSQVFLGVGFAATMPCYPKLVTACFPPEKTGFAIGVAISGYAAGDIVGLNATPYLMNSLGNWRTVFIIYGAWTLILTGIWWAFARQPEQSDAINPPQKTKSSPSLTKILAGLLREKQMWLLTGLYFSSAACYDTLLVWLPSILMADGFDIATAGLVTSMLPLGFLSASFAIGTLSDRIGSRKPFILLLGLVSGPAIYAVGTSQGTSVWFFSFLAGLCTISVLSLLLVIPAELPQTALIVGSAVGLISSMGNVGSFFMPTLVGYVKDVTGSYLGAIVILAVLGESMFFLALPLTETGRKRRQTLSSHRS